MKRILLAGLLFAKVKSASQWFEVQKPSLAVTGVALSGPNQEYVLQGEILQYEAFEIDWGGASATPVKDLSTTNPRIQPFSRIEAGGGFDSVMASHTLLRLNAQQGVPKIEQEYSVPTGNHYTYPIWVSGTKYVVTASEFFAAPTELRAYRLQSDTINDVKVYNTGANSKGIGVVPQTGWFVVSLMGSNVRKIFDLTNGYIGGSNSTVFTHLRSDSNHELSFFSPEGDRGVYVLLREVVNELHTVSIVDGSDRLFHVISGIPVFWRPLGSPTQISVSLGVLPRIKLQS